MKTLLLIDAHSLIHRAYHALPPLTTPGGEPIGAIYGLSSTLLKSLSEIKPDYTAAAFDRPETTFRKEMFDEYKAHRPKADDNLVSQLIAARETFSKMNIPIFEAPKYEADDIIGTLVKKMASGNIQITILTGDLDTLQLVRGKKIVVKTPKKGIGETVVYDEDAVMSRFGVPPSMITDYKGLVGDPSDNIPGVPGVGPKIAVVLIKKFGTVEDIFSSIRPNDPLFKKINGHRERAELSKKLATIACSVPLSASLEDLRFRGIQKDALYNYFSSLGFESLKKRVEEEKEIAPTAKSAPVPPHKIILGKKDIRPESEDNVLVAMNWKTIFSSLPPSVSKKIKNTFDIGIAGWLLDSSEKDLSIKNLCKKTGVAIENKEEKSVIEELFVAFHKKLDENGTLNLAYSLEFPLTRVIVEMERWGIKIDTQKLIGLKKTLKSEISNIEKEIYGIAGVEFNIRSPKQVSDLLYEKMGMSSKKTRTTKSGIQSTSERALSSLKGKHEIVGKILEFREYEKIRSTYVDPILEFVGNDGRIHASFDQAGTTTGRISSEKPNLQNIPQESRWSKFLRSSFSAEDGFSLVSFDYSQLELRLLAHTAKDEKMKDAFFKNQDIHAITASNIFHIPISSVTAPFRRVAKTLNFGIAYGMGARAFSETSGLSLEDAKKFIDEYFAAFPAILEWQEKIKQSAKNLGYVRTENGRRRHFQDSTNQRVVSEIERAAINMPIQGLGADILKKSMIDIFLFLEEEKIFPGKARIVLSIHDELIFEIRDDILRKIIPQIKKIMECVQLISVPLLVELKAGKNLGEMTPIDSENSNKNESAN